MLRRDRGQMRIRDEIGLGGDSDQQATQDLSMVVQRPWNPSGPLVQPAFHLLPGISRRRGTLENPRVGDDPDERQKARPGQSDSDQSVELGVQPVPCVVVLFVLRPVRVDEEVRVDRDQR